MKQIGYSTFLLIVSFISTTAFGADVVPPINGIPAAAQPGGAMPQLTKPMLPLIKKKPALIKPQESVKKKPTHLGQMIPVQRFKIVGVQSHTQAGITQAKIDLMAEQSRQTFLAKNRKHRLKETHPAVSELTLSQIYGVAQQLTHLYRSAGYIFTTVHIPPQKIKSDGVVKLQVVEGKLGHIATEGKKTIYAKDKLIWPFQSLTGKSVRAQDVESALLTLNNYPGYQGHGVFVNGKKPGTTDLIIKTDQERRLKAALGTDNNGSELSGRYHAIGKAHINNITGAADQLSLTWIQNFHPSRGHYGGFSYTRPIFSPNIEMGVSYDRNGYTLGGDYKHLDFSGVSNTGTVLLKNTWIRKRRELLSSTVSLSRKQAKTKMGSLEYGLDNLTVLGLRASYSRFFSSLRARLSSDLSYQHGFDHFLGAMDEHFGAHTTPSSRRKADGEYVGGYFNSFNLSLSYLQKLFVNQNLLFKLNGQYSPDALVSLQQFGLGGVNSVRAYPSSSYLMDRGISGTAEWIVPIPFVGQKTFNKKYKWGDVVHFSTFADFGAGWLNHSTASQKTHVSISGFGLGAEFNLPGALVCQLQWAKPFGFSHQQPSDHRDSRIWFDIYWTI